MKLSGRENCAYNGCFTHVEVLKALVASSDEKKWKKFGNALTHHVYKITFNDKPYVIKLAKTFFASRNGNKVDSHTSMKDLYNYLVNEIEIYNYLMRV
jgi:hypothetical protein